MITWAIGVSRRIREKARVSRYGQMDHYMKDIGGMIRQMEKVDLFILMGMSMRVIGFPIKLKVMEFTLTWMVLNTKANGRRINSTVRVKRHGQTVQCTKVTISMERNTASVTSSGVMARYTRGNSTTTILKVKVNTDGQMAGHSEASGRITKCMVGVCSHGQMEGSMKASTLRIKNKAKGHSTGLMAGDTSDNGLMANSMVGEHLWQLMGNRDKGNGITEREPGGLMKEQVDQIL
jgi:hypothetical protein